MEGFIKQLQELDRVFWGIQVYRLFLDLLIGFLFFSIVLQFLGASILYSLPPTILYLLILATREILARDVLGGVEKEYPELNERLKTAYDNRGTEGNVIVEDLLSSVSKTMENVSSSSFLSSGGLAVRVYITLVLVFLLLSVSFIDIRNIAAGLMNPDLMKNNYLLNALANGSITFGDQSRWEMNPNYTAEDPNKLGAEPGGEQPGYSEGPIPGVGGGVGSSENPNIYGDPSAASLGDSSVHIELHPEYGGSIHIEESNQQLSGSGVDIGQVESSQQCEDCIVGPEYEEIVRRYFEKLLEGG